MVTSFRIGSHTVGGGHPVYIIAELSGNHNQDFDQAVALIHAAKEAGADAVKLQTYTPDTITIDCDNDFFRIRKGTVWEGKNLYTLYSEAFTPWEWQPRLKRIANDIGLDLFSTPFDFSSIDFLEEMDVPVYKIASFEIVDIPLIREVARRKKPVIISTGMATYEEIDEAVQTVRNEGNNEIALLKCTSAYPAPASACNLRTILDLVRSFNVPVGLSDHTRGITVPVTAIALGACIIEKHLTLSRSIHGPDSTFSLEPAEFLQMVAAIREAESSLGSVTYEITDAEKASRSFRRSLFFVKDIEKGEIITAENIRSIRPGYGLPPKFYNDLLGKCAKKKISRGTPVSWNLVE